MMSYRIYPINIFYLFPSNLGKSTSRIIDDNKSPLLEISNSNLVPKLGVPSIDCCIDSIEKFVCLL